MHLKITPAPGTAIDGSNSMIFGAWSEDLSGLMDYNFKILNLANNHAFDQGVSGV